jgi:CelD/BcsL family acetyltransferase involved in cellulose biosynthesis
MYAKTLTTISGLLAYVKEWNELALSNAKSAFQMPGWVLPWWNTFGCHFRLHCIAVFESGQMIGLAPLMLAKRLGLRCLQFIGSPLNDYNAFLTKPNLMESVGRCVFEHLAKEADQWDLFEGFVIDRFEYAIGLKSNAEIKGIHIAVLRSEPAPIIRLPNSWEEYCASLPTSRRRSFQYSKRHLCREGLSEFEICTNPDEIVNYIEEFEKKRLLCWQHRGLLNRVPVIIRMKSFSTFLKYVANQLPITRGLHFALIKKNHNIIATGLYFSAGSRLLKYMQSWDFAYAHSSPGTVLDWMMIEYAIKKGFSIFDFGRGEEEYKFRFGAETHQLQNAVFSPTTLRGFIGANLARGADLIISKIETLTRNIRLLKK